jgi:hypothetical protein
MDNKMEGEIPAELAELNNLQDLLLSSNSFSGNLPTEFVKLTNLKTLMLSDNNLKQDYITISGNGPRNLSNIIFHSSMSASVDMEKE